MEQENSHRRVATIYQPGEAGQESSAPNKTRAGARLQAASLCTGGKASLCATFRSKQQQPAERVVLELLLLYGAILRARR